MIKAEGISKHFGKTIAVDNISFSVNEGENLILLGTSGCGKTTTIRMLNRLIEATSGSISINGASIYSQQPDTLRRNIGYVLQHNALFPHYTVAENIAIVPKLLKWTDGKIVSRTKVLLQKLHLPESCLSNYPGELSGGQQQRVNVARALAAEPPILLMDEPFGALDPITRAGIVREFMELDELKKKTIVMVTHDVEEAFEMGDKICLMDSGRIMQIGTPVQLLFSPENEYVRSFLDKHFLQLALKQINIEDIWESLPAVINETDGLSMVSAKSSLWDAIAFFTKGTAKEYIQISNAGNEIKQVRLNELFTAFNQYKKN